VPSAEVILSLLGLGAICTATAFLVFFALIAEVGPARATVITYVNPAVAVALGVLVLGEHLTPEIAGAFVLILGGSVLATRSSSRPPAPPAPATPPAASAALAPADAGPRPEDRTGAASRDDGQPLSRFSRSVADGEPKPVQGSQPGPAE
jgi:hypothetical protein